MNKKKTAREGTLPDYLSVDKQLVVEPLQHLFIRIGLEKMNQLVDMIGYEGVLMKPKIMMHNSNTTELEPETNNIT